MRYSYIIYKIYSWTANKPNDTPVLNTVLTLAVVHGLQGLTVFMYLNALFFHLDNLFDFSQGYVVVAAFAWAILLHLLLYNKERWDGYVQQYQGEDARQRKRGNDKVMAFCVLSVVAFFVSLPISSALFQRFLH